MIPSGNAKSMLPAIRQHVPTIAGKIPPAVIPSVGGVVRNSQLITPTPLYRINPNIQNNTHTTRIPSILKIIKAMN
jgi:hypothetical protein